MAANLYPFALLKLWILRVLSAKLLLAEASPNKIPQALSSLSETEKPHRFHEQVVKLPRWFKVETPIGTYNPDWAIVKQEEATIYLVRETKSTRNFEKLRNAEAEKIRCGRRHFEALGTGFDVVTLAGEV